MRGKIGLTMLEDGSWGAAYGQALNTWIAKVEDNPRLPGEAGIEAICQRAFAVLGIDSAVTASQVFDGVQTVLSRRSDRVGTPEAGNVTARHQEDMAQQVKFVLNVISGSLHSIMGRQLSLASLRGLGTGFCRHRGA